MATNNNQLQIQKTANGVKIAAFLSLATNLYQIYFYTQAPDGILGAVSLGLGVIGTILIWQLATMLKAEKKHSLYYWLALILVGYSRWIFIDASFTINVASIAVMALTIILTLRIANWTRKNALI